jgi:peptidoglycan-N-acetylglucosamine deacetylase
MSQTISNDYKIDHETVPPQPPKKKIAIKMSPRSKKFSIYLVLLIFLTTFSALISSAWLTADKYWQTSVTPKPEIRGAFEVVDSLYSFNNPAFVNLEFDYFSTIKEKNSNFDTLVLPKYSLQDKNWVENLSPDYDDLKSVIKIEQIKSNLLANFNFGDSKQTQAYLSQKDIQKDLTNLLKKIPELKGYKGLNLTLPLNDLSPIQWSNLQTLITQIRSELSKENKVLTLTVSHEGLENQEKRDWLVNNLDRIYLRLWSQNSQLADLSPSSWSNLITKLPANKVSLILPTFQQQQIWSGNSLSRVDYISYEVVEKEIIQPNTKINYVSNLYPVAETEQGGKKIQISFQDATSIYNYRNYIDSLSPNSHFELGISDLGGSEPTSFDQLKKANLDTLKNYKSTVRVERMGQGSVIDNITLGKQGERSIDLKDQFVSDQKISKPFEMAKVELSGVSQNKLSITFDDGPDPVFTPQILDLLKQYNAKATFFVVGRKVKQYPEIIKRILAEGHQIENHSFNHIRLASKEQLQSEINYTDQTLNDFGVATKYFRAPYNQLSNNSEKDLDYLIEVKNMGKFNINDDYNGYDYVPNITGAQIAEKIISQVKKNPGSVIVLHDSDGEMIKNRQETIEALKILLPTLKDQYQFVKLSQIHTKPNPAVVAQVSKSTKSTKPFETTFDTLKVDSIAEWKTPPITTNKYGNISTFYLILVSLLFSLLIVSFVFGRIFKTILNN